MLPRPAMRGGSFFSAAGGGRLPLWRPCLKVFPDDREVIAVWAGGGEFEVDASAAHLHSACDLKEQHTERSNRGFGQTGAFELVALELC